MGKRRQGCRRALSWFSISNQRPGSLWLGAAYNCEDPCADRLRLRDRAQCSYLYWSFADSLYLVPKANRRSSRGRSSGGIRAFGWFRFAGTGLEWTFSVAERAVDNGEVISHGAISDAVIKARPSPVHPVLERQNSPSWKRPIPLERYSARSSTGKGSGKLQW